MNFKNLNELFKEYKIKKVKIENRIISSTNAYGICSLDLEEIWEDKQYIDVVENALKNLSKEEAKILISIYIENKFWDELPYSYSTYYKKLKKAENNFKIFMK
ncbi:MAG: hypothetical protein K2J02_03470 [Malacoplasma sp.]|nr:hypothetical protein [Malacoplasma sp.]MDE6894406.1 hypothetical protein [Malacoplasma sp.]